jgi:hypothetical protein
MFKVPEQFRVKEGAMGSDKETHGDNGCFIVRFPNRPLCKYIVIASCNLGWEHVSVHVQKSGTSFTPTWEEMCLIKNLFWDDTDCVVQYHPAKKDYVNCHPNTLHLWRPIDQVLPTPLKAMV